MHSRTTGRLCELVDEFDATHAAVRLAEGLGFVAELLQRSHWTGLNCCATVSLCQTDCSACCGKLHWVQSGTLRHCIAAHPGLHRVATHSRLHPGWLLHLCRELELHLAVAFRTLEQGRTHLHPLGLPQRDEVGATPGTEHERAVDAVEHLRTEVVESCCGLLDVLHRGLHLGRCARCNGVFVIHHFSRVVSRHFGSVEDVEVGRDVLGVLAAARRKNTVGVLAVEPIAVIVGRGNIELKCAASRDDRVNGVPVAVGIQQLQVELSRRFADLHVDDAVVIVHTFDHLAIVATTGGHDWRLAERGIFGAHCGLRTATRRQNEPCADRERDQPFTCLHGDVSLRSGTAGVRSERPSIGTYPTSLQLLCRPIGAAFPGRKSSSCMESSAHLVHRHDRSGNGRSGGRCLGINRLNQHSSGGARRRRDHQLPVVAHGRCLHEEVPSSDGA